VTTLPRAAVPAPAVANVHPPPNDHLRQVAPALARRGFRRPLHRALRIRGFRAYNMCLL
jgi:hypothetical protein